MKWCKMIEIGHWSRLPPLYWLRTNNDRKVKFGHKVDTASCYTSSIFAFVKDPNNLRNQPVRSFRPHIMNFVRLVSITRLRIPSDCESILRLAMPEFRFWKIWIKDILGNTMRLRKETAPLFSFKKGPERFSHRVLSHHQISAVRCSFYHHFNKRAGK